MQTITDLCSMTVLPVDTPGLVLDEHGVSNFARRAQWRLENEVFHGAEGQAKIDQWVSRIKASGRNREYDCIIGLSGGVDSSYVALKVVELGLRPLAIHLDNGWNSDTAVSNIERIVKKLNIDLFTHVVDWSEIRDLQRAYIKASVLDLECVSDHAINTILLRKAAQEKIGFVIHGGNVATESILPPAWGYDKRDGRNLRAIHKKFGSRKLKTYPSMLPRELFYYLFLRRTVAFPILNYIDYNKTDAVRELVANFDWRPYPRKHGENRFTKFFQEYYLPKKARIDKRIAHFSSLIVAGEMTKEDALAQLEIPLYSAGEEREEIEFVSKKLGYSPDELVSLIEKPLVPHTNYSNADWMFDQSSPWVQAARYIAKGEFSWKRLRAVRQAEKEQGNNV